MKRKRFLLMLPLTAVCFALSTPADKIITGSGSTGFPLPFHRAVCEVGFNPATGQESGVTERFDGLNLFVDILFAGIPAATIALLIFIKKKKNSIT